MTDVLQTVSICMILKGDNVEWDDYRDEHLAQHGVEIFEALEAVDNLAHLSKHRGRWVVPGQTDSGRYLAVVLLKSKDRWILITTRDMTDKERRRSQRRGK